MLIRLGFSAVKCQCSQQASDQDQTIQILASEFYIEQNKKLSLDPNHLVLIGWFRGVD